MARSGVALLDWHLFSKAVRVGAAPAVGSRFPVELAPDLIVCPHLFDWPQEAPREHAAYTCAGTPLLMVFCGRGSHVQFLQEEVIPATMRRARHVALIDGDRLHFAVDGWSTWSPLPELIPLLHAAYGTRDSPHQSAAFGRLLSELAGDVDGFERRLFVRPTLAPGRLERLERHPVRLWEALFWRGHAYRYELINGEVPLVANLQTPLAANGTLMQLISDARRLEGTAPRDDEAWIRCGRFRMRQEGALVQVRVSLRPADVRAAFMPRSRVDGDHALPSLVGALMAGGDNGKTELIHGWTWSTVITEGPDMSFELARRFQQEIAEWTGSRVTVTPPTFDLPREPSDEWFITAWKRYLTIHVPFTARAVFRGTSTRRASLPPDEHQRHAPAQLARNQRRAQSRKVAGPANQTTRLPAPGGASLAARHARDLRERDVIMDFGASAPSLVDARTSLSTVPRPTWARGGSRDTSFR